MQAALDSRYRLSTREYDSLLKSSHVVKFGTRNVVLDGELVELARTATKERPRLYLREIKDYHREYEWLQ
jgi:polyketide biosynthesis 3-hydroxy-3-methylglutaryl-CoA synthase-like enzyme PksG